jgi:hypothetical protein
LGIELEKILKRTLAQPSHFTIRVSPGLLERSEHVGTVPNTSDLYVSGPARSVSEAKPGTGPGFPTH